ncbi:MAG: DPP IV N-terminal domain-containing protein [Balneolaceae bacterium]|nr:DPP IV N-terminal domain-containing protein [Balneolaceae bacterium]
MGLFNHKIAKIAVLFIIFLCGFQISTYAQKANFEQAERFSSQMMDKMTGNTSVYPRWIEDQDRFWYSYETGEGKNWYFVDVPKNSKRLLFDQEEMAAQLNEIFNKPFDSKDLPLKEFEYNVKKGLFTFNVDSINFEYKISGNELIKGDSVKKEKPDNWKTYSPDSTWIAYAKNHNLYIMSADTSDTTEHQLTDDGEKWYSFQADASDTTSDKKLRSIARWFDDSEKIYARRDDMRDVKDLWVINELKERPELETYKYPMPGDKNIGKSEIWFFNPDNKESVKMQVPEKEHTYIDGGYFNEGGIYHGPGSDHLYVLQRTREYDHVDVLKVSTNTGESEVLFSETSKPYINWEFTKLAEINGGEEYIWWSERTGWGQLYPYDSEGNVKNRITKGHFVVGDVVKIDTTEREIYFEGYGREAGVNPYHTQFYKINFNGSGMKRLTSENANHSISESDKGNFFVDNYSRPDMPTKSVVRNAEGKIKVELEETDLSRLKEAGWKAPEEFKVKAADDATDLYGVMWKPFDFDSTKTYPVITYVYPGPQVEPFPRSFSLNGRNTSLAQLGFIVVAMGQRGGSPLRSKYYHNYGYDNLRDYPLIDNKYGIEQLATRYSYVDDSKVGIFGHSGGGFMSTAALLTYPDFYDVAVSSAGNHDNNVYYHGWSEIHNGVKKETKKVKTDSTESDSVKVTWDADIKTNMELAENLKGNLLLVHGTIDNNVHPANSIRMANALIKAGKRFDYMVMPGKRHGFGDYNPYFVRMMWYYFAEHLLGDKRDIVDFNIPEYDE